MNGRKWWLVVCAVVLASLAGTARAETEVPLLVNVQPGVTISDDDLAGMVAEANKILKPAGIKIKFNKSTDIKRDANDQGNNNGKIENGEDGKLDPAGVTELNKHTGTTGKGVKIYISKEIHGSPSTLGLAAHNPDSPVIYLKAGQTQAKGGNTIAHEFAHVFTLGPNHKVTGTTNADPNGHISTPGNLMHPTSDGTELTDEQKAELAKGVKGHGAAITWLDRGWRWLKDQFGYSASVSPTQLMSGGISQRIGTGELGLDVGFTGQAGAGQQHVIQIGLNTDNNPGTGWTLTRADGTLVPGIDRTVDILIAGDPTAGGSVIGHLLDGGGNPMGGPLDIDFERVPKLVDNEFPAEDEAYAACDWIRLSLPESQLGIVAGECRAEFISKDPLDPGIGDYDTVMFDLNAPADEPEIVLQAEAHPGEMVAVQGAGFFPNVVGGLLQFDDEEVGSFITDINGILLGNFLVPPDAENDWYYITASTIDPVMGEQTQFAFKMMKVVPEPTSMALLTAGMAALAWRRRREAVR